MKLIISVLCGFLIQLAVTEGGSNFVVGGENATIQDYPYMAGVLNFGIPSCGGSIITARSVLTEKKFQQKPLEGFHYLFRPLTVSLLNFLDQYQFLLVHPNVVVKEAELTEPCDSLFILTTNLIPTRSLSKLTLQLSERFLELNLELRFSRFHSAEILFHPPPKSC